MITLENAHFQEYGEALDALRWYGNLSFEQRQGFIDHIGIHRAEIIHKFTVDALWYINDLGYTNGFDEETLVDLWQRIRRKLQQEGVW